MIIQTIKTEKILLKKQNIFKILDKYIKEGNIPKKDRSKCHSGWFTCDFFPLCEPGAFERKDYFDMLCSSFFTKKDPMEHLAEDKE